LTFQIPDNATTARLRNLPLQAIRLWFSGDMHAREAGALAQLCNFLHRVIPTAELEARVAMLEEPTGTEGNRSFVGSWPRWEEFRAAHWESFRTVSPRWNAASWR
jgi:hypothetical protein